MTEQHKYDIMSNCSKYVKNLSNLKKIATNLNINFGHNCKLYFTGYNFLLNTFFCVKECTIIDNGNANSISIDGFENCLEIFGFKSNIPITNTSPSTTTNYIRFETKSNEELCQDTSTVFIFDYETNKGKYDKIIHKNKIHIFMPPSNTVESDLRYKFSGAISENLKRNLKNLKKALKNSILEHLAVKIIDNVKKNPFEIITQKIIDTELPEPKSTDSDEIKMSKKIKRENFLKKFKVNNFTVLPNTPNNEQKRMQDLFFYTIYPTNSELEKMLDLFFNILLKSKSPHYLTEYEIDGLCERNNQKFYKRILYDNAISKLEFFKCFLFANNVSSKNYFVKDTYLSNYSRLLYDEVYGPLHYSNPEKKYYNGYLFLQDANNMVSYDDGIKLLNNKTEKLVAMKSVAQAVAKIHELNISHRGLRGSKFLFDTENKIFKIVSFRTYDMRNKMNTCTMHIANSYDAPEVRERRFPDVTNCMLGDIFSVGWIFYEIWYGQRKYYKNFNLDDNMDNELQVIIKKLTNTVATERGDIFECLESIDALIDK